MLALLTIAVILIVYGAFSKPLDAKGVTAAIALTAAGLIAGPFGLGLIDVQIESVVVERVVEIALVLLLFSDAARLDLRLLRDQLGWPGRLLLIGLPLTLLAGTGVGLPAVSNGY
jgi:NhaP-type Na+/H+ or K+/H+ antiporter